MRIQITVKKDHKMYRKYPTPYRLTNFINSKAKLLLNKGFKISIKVFYDNGFDNEIKNCSMDDLVWASGAFVKEYEK